MGDPDSTSLLTNIAILGALILCNAFFATSEIAIITLNDNKIKKMAQEGNRKAGMIARLISEPSRFLATIQVGVTLSGFLASAVAAGTFSEYVVRWLSHLPLQAQTVRGFSIVIITILLSFLTLVFGELVPKRVAMQHYERISFAVARPVSAFATIGKPFVWLLSAATNGILRLMGIDPNHRPEEVTEEEIRMMIDVGGESGTIEQSEKDMLNNIFEFDDSTAEDMMTHRTEITAVEIGAPLDQVIAVAVESGHSRIPVYEEDLDSIVGILYIKDLLELITHPLDEDFDLRNYMREPMYVLESTRSATLLGEFQAKKIQIAIVIDEYGGTSGLISMEDLLEEIVGNIQDEYDDEEEDIAKVDENQYLISGLAPLDDVLEFFSLEVEDEDDYDTVGGYVINLLGYIPPEHDRPSVRIGDVRFTVRTMEERRIDKLVAEVMPPLPEELEEQSLRQSEA